MPRRKCGRGPKLSAIEEYSSPQAVYQTTPARISATPEDGTDESRQVTQACLADPVASDFGPFQTKNLMFRAPLRYPFLERPLNIFLPLHFTYTQVDIVHERGHVWYEAFMKIQVDLIKICASFEPPIVQSSAHLSMAEYGTIEPPYRTEKSTMSHRRGFWLSTSNHRTCVAGRKWQLELRNCFKRHIDSGDPQFDSTMVAFVGFLLPRGQEHHLSRIEGEKAVSMICLS